MKAKAGVFARYAAGRFATVTRNPVLVLGNQKSGTTVIAAALAHCANLTVTLDIRDLDASLLAGLYDGSVSTSRFVNRYRRSFSRTVIKEPGLTFAYEKLQRDFPNATFVLIVRDPRDNIRSVLDRLDLPGNASSLPPGTLNNLNPIWRQVLENRVLGIEADHYVEALAHRWNRATNVYLQHPDRIHLVRYEEFCRNEATYIQSLARRLDLPVNQSPTSIVETQHQPAGNRNVSWKDFFGPRNLSRIERICSENMTTLGYSSP